MKAPSERQLVSSIMQIAYKAALLAPSDSAYVMLKMQEAELRLQLKRIREPSIDL